MHSISEVASKSNKTDKYFTSDQQFDKLLPLEYRYHSSKHFTPLDVALKAATFLSEASTNPHTLDIGAGVGKFCAVAGHFTKTRVTGIEQRKDMVNTGNNILDFLNIPNARLKSENITQTDFGKFTGIYFFNSFYENIDPYGVPIDSTIHLSASLFRQYTDFLYKKLDEMPVYTRLATYHTFLTDVPGNYTELESFFAGNLKLWIKYD